MTGRRRVVICGAAGRDFHNFNVLYRDDPGVEVVAFTGTQIPGIEDRRVPPVASGALYPEGIAIRPEVELASLCRELEVDEVVFAYSDVTRDHVMSVAAVALGAGASFALPGPTATMLPTHKPSIAVCAVRTGCGKSQIARHIAGKLSERGVGVAVLRHPMPYGELANQTVQRFASMDDLDAADCTVEEREEYEPHIASGGVVFAGVDYAKILAAAQAEADVILWDGGNNDHPFIAAGLNIVVVDALRPDHLDTHYPGDSVLLRADLVVCNKIGAATSEQLVELEQGLGRLVPGTPRIHAASPVRVDRADELAGKRVVIVEDGPTITHGGMPHGAGFAAVQNLPVAEIIDPRRHAAPGIAAVYEAYPHIGPVLPAMGYSAAQRAELAQTIEQSGADVVVSGSPIDLARALALDVPVARAHYDYQDAGDPGDPGLMHVVDEFLLESLPGDSDE
jgi:predicted GTPase